MSVSSTRPRSVSTAPGPKPCGLAATTPRPLHEPDGGEISWRTASYGDLIASGHLGGEPERVGSTQPCGSVRTTADEFLEQLIQCRRGDAKHRLRPTPVQAVPDPAQLAGGDEPAELPVNRCSRSLEVVDPEEPSPGAQHRASHLTGLRTGAPGHARLRVCNARAFQTQPYRSSEQAQPLGLIPQLRRFDSLLAAPSAGTSPQRDHRGGHGGATGVSCSAAPGCHCGHAALRESVRDVLTRMDGQAGLRGHPRS